LNLTNGGKLKIISPAWLAVCSFCSFYSQFCYPWVHSKPSRTNYFQLSTIGQIQGFYNYLLVVVVAKIGGKVSKSIICEGTKENIKNWKGRVYLHC
jgi:hypothetical protein